MRYVLTGASGPIGISLINLLLQKGHKVLVLSSSSKLDSLFKLEKNLDCISLFIQDYISFTPTVPADVFIHMGWQGGSDRENFLLNQSSVIGSVNAVDLAYRFGCTQFIGAGSQAEYGVSEITLSHDSPCNPIHAFGAAKLSASLNCRFRCEKLGLRFIWPRIFSVYGPYDRRSSLVASTINLLLKKASVAFTQADNLWDFLYSSDAANALYLLSISPSAEGYYVLASGISLPLKSYISLICAQFKVDPDPYLGLIRHPSSTISLRADISRLRGECNWNPTVDFGSGIIELIRYEMSIP